MIATCTLYGIHMNYQSGNLQEVLQ
jgi:hypothetical protein